MIDAKLKGKLIVFEGIDRSGKTTQLMLTSRKFNELNIPHVVYRYPTRDTHIGCLLQSVLKDPKKKLSKEALYLLFAADRWVFNDEIIEYLKKGIHVLVDRYTFSGIAYAVGAERLQYEWVKGVENGMMSPDVVVYLDNQPETSQARGGFGDQCYEKIQILIDVYEAYRNFARLPYWVKVDANRTIEHPKVFPGGPPPQYYPGLAPLDFKVRMGFGTFDAVWPTAMDAQWASNITKKLDTLTPGRLKVIFMKKFENW